MDSTREKLSTEERKEKTLKRVAEEFAENGFEGTRTADLAEAAGVSEAMLVKLYESKENLYKALIKHKTNEFPETAFPSELAEEASPETVLKQMARNLCERCDDDPTFFRLLYYSGLEDNELSDLFYEERIENTVSQLSEYIRINIENGNFRNVDPETAAIGLIGTICHVIGMDHIFDFPLPGNQKKEKLTDQFVDYVLNGITK